MAFGVGTTHNVKIGSDYFLIRPGSYRKRPAPLFGARFTTGDPDWNTLSFWQHWVQRCWVGGIGAEDWQDDAMFDESAGVDTSNHEVLLLSRDLSNSGMTNSLFSVEGGSPRLREFFTWNGVDDAGVEALYCLTYGPTSGGDSWLHRWSPSTADSWVLVHTFTALTTRSLARWRNRIYFGTAGASLAILAGNPGAESFSTVAKPAGMNTSYAPYAMRSYNDRLYVSVLTEVYRMLPDGTWDGSTAFYDAPGINYIIDMEAHLGFLYMASQNGHILRTDGNNTFDMWTMEPGSLVENIRSFDGRLFISVMDPLEGTSASEAVLFQFSGSAVTELKRFGTIGVEMSLARLRVVGGRLMFGASSLLGFDDGFGIGMYDPVEDSYHVFATNRDSVTYTAGTEQSSWMVDDIFYYRGYLWCSVRGHGIFRAAYTVRDVSRLLAHYDTTAAGVSAGAGNGGWLSSSDFDAGTPGLLKLWNSVILVADLPHSSCSVTLEYSTDGGDTWVEHGTMTKTGSAMRYTQTFKLGSVADGGVYASRFKYRLTLRTTNTTYSPAVRGIVVRYLPVPEPNWLWDMTLVLSEDQELLDGSYDSPDNDAKIAALEASFRAQNLITFTDIRADTWASDGSPGAIIQNLDVRAPSLGASSEGAIEYEVNITIAEAVETYEY